MKEKPKSTKSSNDHLFLTIAVTLFLGLLVTKLQLGLKWYWETHPVRMVLSIQLVLLTVTSILGSFLWNRRCKADFERSITQKEDGSVPLGTNDTGQELHLKRRYRTSHTQVIGTTSAGKTESVILPWIVNDIRQGAGTLIIDGKSDKSFLDKLYSYCVKAGREEDFRLFSLAHIEQSTPFNPLSGASPLVVAERVFSSFPMDNEYYKSVQFKLFLSAIHLLHERKELSFDGAYRLLTDKNALGDALGKTKLTSGINEIEKFYHSSERVREEKVSGLTSQLSYFTQGELRDLFVSTENAIDLDKALSENSICYFQLPTMYYPFVAEATGKLVLQCFQSAVSKRHLGLSGKPNFFSVFLDDFQDYIYPGFSGLLNKSRSANIGVVFSHQSLGDLEKVGTYFKNVVLTNTNVKCIMRNNDPDTCDYFSRSLGTRKGEKRTETRIKNILGDSKTGMGSVREVEEFVYHPNVIKQLGIGEAIVTVPHSKGVRIEQVQFSMIPNIEPVPIKKTEKKEEKKGAQQVNSKETQVQTENFQP